MKKECASLKFADGAPRAATIVRLAACLAGLGAAASAFANDAAEDRLQVHGFLTQGAVRSSHNNFYGNSSQRVSFDFSEIGLNASYQATPVLRFAAQVMSRRAGEMDKGDPWLDYGMADLTLVNDDRKHAGVRVGRMKNPFGLYTETRDVAFTRPGAIVPQPIYFDRSRKFALSGDGVHLYSEFVVPGGTLDAMVGAVKLPIDDPSSKSAIVAPNAPGELEQDRMTTGFRILYETEDRRWRGGASYFSLSQEYHPAAGDRLPSVHADIDPWILSLQYTDDKWTLTSEYSRRKNDIKWGTRTVNYNTSENWYVQAQYRFQPQWELLLRYDSSLADLNDRGGEAASAATRFRTPAHAYFARDWVAGLRYDVTSRFMVRAEFHRVDGTGWLSALDNPVPGDMARRWNMVMLLGSYRF